MKVMVQPSTITGTVRVPPSKSLTHRAVVLATLAQGESVIENSLISDDTRMTIEACRQFGADIVDKDGKLVVRGTGGKLRVPEKIIDCGFSGTSLRLLTAVAALAPGKVTLTGGVRLMERPMGPLLEALSQAGVETWSEGVYLVIQGGRLAGGKVALSGAASSQFISALLLIAPYAEKEVCLEPVGNVRSRPYIDLTLDVMGVFGGQVNKDNHGYRVAPQHYRATSYSVEGDWSAAQYWVAAAAVTGGAVTLLGINADSAQGDKRILQAAEAMGCTIKMAAGNITVIGPARLRPIELDGGDIPDLVPTIAVMAAFAKGESRITNIAHLREKESDRLAVPVQELKKMGISAAATRDSLIVYGGKPKGAGLNSHNDHRIAMAFAVAGLAAEGKTVIQDAEAVSKSYPLFWDDFKYLTQPSFPRQLESRNRSKTKRKID